MQIIMQYGAGEREFEQAAELPQWSLCRVISQSAGSYRIVGQNGEWSAVVSGLFRHEVADTLQFPVVGDYVLAEPAGNGSALIQRVLERRSLFVRKDPGDSHTQAVAANMDLVFVCMSLNGNFRLSRMERYLSVAWSSGATPVVVLTKSDLAEDLPSVLAQARAAAPGTDVLAVSSLSTFELDPITAYLKPGITAVFLGSSGVGKSTLINRLLGETRLDTGAVRKDGKGRHTTTRRELMLLPCGAIVMDTPGMRELGMETADLARSFPEIEALAAQCRFGDCSHTVEPGCAVQAAIRSGELDARRLDSYQKLQRETRYNGLNSRALEAEKCGVMFAQAGGMKKIRKYIRQNDKRF